jgi:hypothetical protein
MDRKEAPAPAWRTPLFERRAQVTKTIRSDALALAWNTPGETNAKSSRIPANKRFVLHSTVVAVKLLSRQTLVVLSKQTQGMIMERLAAARAPGLVLIEIEGEKFLVWRRDLDECAELL